MPILAFSILERIDVGETMPRNWPSVARWRLSVSSNGSTWVKLALARVWLTQVYPPFSILERIDVGETTSALKPGAV